MTPRPLVLDAGVLFAPDAMYADRAAAMALLAQPLALAGVARITTRGVQAVAVRPSAAGESVTAIRAWLLGQGPRPMSKGPGRGAGAWLRRPPGRLPQGAILLVPGLAPWAGPALRALRRSRPDVGVLALTTAPTMLDWPDYATEAAPAATGRALAALGEGAAAIVAPDDGARDVLHAALVAAPRRPPIHVVAPPVLPLPDPTAAVDDALAAVPYLLVIDCIEARANIAMLLHLWRDLIHRGIPVPRLVLAGERGRQVEEIRPLLDWNETIRAHVAEAPSLSPAALAHLARHARAVLAPAFAQADGTLLQALVAQGTPVIATDMPATRAIRAITRCGAIDGPAWREAIVAAGCRNVRPRESLPPVPRVYAGVIAALAATL